LFFHPVPRWSPKPARQILASKISTHKYNQDSSISRNISNKVLL
jgi:hypothetical protein